MECLLEGSDWQPGHRSAFEHLNWSIGVEVNDRVHSPWIVPIDRAFGTS